MEKFLYFRADSTLANDDDNANGSNIVKVSDLISMASTSDTALALRFKPRMNAFGADQDDTTGTVLNKTDSFTLTVAANAQKDVIERILAAIAKPQIAGSPNMITVYDAVSGDGIKGVTAVSVSIAAAQS